MKVEVVRWIAIRRGSSYDWNTPVAVVHNFHKEFQSLIWVRSRGLFSKGSRGVTVAVMSLIGLFSGDLFGDVEFNRMADKASRPWKVPKISLEDVLALNSESYVLLDAREAREFQVSHLPSAIHIGYHTFKVDRLKNSNFGNKKLIVYCSVGYRSGEIAEKMKASGYNAFNLVGGLFQWVNNRKPLVNSKNQKTLKVHGYSKKWSRWLRHGQVVLD